jgi:hypothetical protein
MGSMFSWLRSAPPQLQSKDLEGVAEYIASGKCKNIVIMVRSRSPSFLRV